ncbi:Ig-like domain-containing protein [Aquimarina sp. MMG016]|uniref:Ig-like domain-containing protein n=1 Tax=Aquimarina sp. MMG016 TaxID=2822690 RepID=UPI001B39EDA9|nr:Ig-like domain-containing protein [Aquimarina sp. MMG016]MBQ4818779.1 T9SS type A sorting domain-containing protein [Aquimarina sp. MMG016]
MKKQLLLSSFLLCLFSSSSIFSQFSLGDIAFSAYNSDNSLTPEDSFTIVLLRDVSSGESLGFTENGWFAAGGFRSGENSCTLTFSSNYPTGTQIVISRSPFQALDQDGSSAGALSGAGLSFAVSGDQIFAYDPNNIPSVGNETGFVAAIQMNGDWDTDASSTTTSAKPSVFTDGVNSISISPEVDNARFDPTNCSNFTDINSLRTLLNTVSNWQFDNATPYTQSPPACDFTVNNNIPTASSFTASPGPFEDQVYTFVTADFGYNDTDSDPLDNLLVELVPPVGTLYVDADNDDTFDGGEQLSNGSTVSKADLDAGNLQYVQAGSVNTSFQFEVNDGTENSTGNYVATLNVTAVNDEPSFTPGANETVNEDAGVQTVNAWATSIDDGDTEATQTLTFAVTNDNNALFSTQPAIDASGNLTYTPATNANGSATVDVILSDDGGTANGGDDTFATQQFTITVNAVNDEPSFTPGANETINEDPGAQTVNGWATSIDDGDTEATQTLTFAVTNDNNALFSTQPAIDASGNLTYTPATNANGSATVDVILSDDGGTANGGDDTFATQQFTITVNAVNDAPSFSLPGSPDQSVGENSGAQTVNMFATSIDDGDAETVQTLTFNVSNDNNALFSVQPAIDASGNLTYTPATDALGTATITVNISDDGGTANGGSDTSANQTFNITIADITPPTVMITSTESPGPTGANPIPITITFSESVTGFDVNDLIVSNGASGGFSGSGTTYSVDITPTANGIVTVDVGASVAVDNAGNDNTAAPQFSITYNSTLSVQDELLAQGVKIYPMPNTGVLNISADTSLKLKNVQVFDITGKLIYSKQLDSGSVVNTFDISDIQSGMYLITVNSVNAKATKRMVIQ